MPSERAEGLRHLQPELSDLGERLPGGLGSIAEEAAVPHARLVGFTGLVNELGTILIVYDGDAVSLSRWLFDGSQAGQSRG